MVLFTWCGTVSREVLSPGGFAWGGCFAKVRLGTDLRTSEIFAVKEIDKKSYEPREVEFTIREVNIMMKITHPNIVNTHDIFENVSHLHLVIEYMQGGELFDIIADQGHLSEQRASQVLRDIITAVDYLHTLGVVHCDIKPENILCKTKQWPLMVKLCDFGLANVIDQSASAAAGANASMSATTGTPGYVAPEVILKKKYGPPVDMWAIGVVLYVMLSGRMPFYGRSDVECLRRTANGQYSFPDREWRNISDDAKSLVRALLQLNPEKRLTARAALQHGWLAVPEQLSTSPVGNDLSGIHSSKRKFRKLARAVVLVQRMRDLGALAAAANGAAKSPASGAPSSAGTSGPMAPVQAAGLSSTTNGDTLASTPQLHDAINVSTASESVSQNA